MITSKRNFCVALSIAIFSSSCATGDSGLNTSSRLLQKETSRPIEIEKSIVNLAGGKWNDAMSFNENLSETINSKEYSVAPELKRNEVQDYLIAMSNQNCGKFKRNTLEGQSFTNFGLGALSTTLATAGALLSPASTSQALSGSAAGFTAVQSQYGKDFFREKAFEIITRAMNVRRKELLGQMDVKRRDKGYTISRAIADSIDYNNACSLIEGLEELNDSVSSQEEKVEQEIDDLSLIHI